MTTGLLSGLVEAEQIACAAVILSPAASAGHPTGRLTSAATLSALDRAMPFTNNVTRAPGRTLSTVTEVASSGTGGTTFGTGSSLGSGCTMAAGWEVPSALQPCCRTNTCSPAASGSQSPIVTSGSAATTGSDSGSDVEYTWSRLPGWAPVT